MIDRCLVYWDYCFGCQKRCVIESVCFFRWMVIIWLVFKNSSLYTCFSDIWVDLFVAEIVLTCSRSLQLWAANALVFIFGFFF